MKNYFLLRKYTNARSRNACQWKIELAAGIGANRKYIMQIRVKENKQKIFHLKKKKITTTVRNP